jgi:uncharacterized membrane protein YqaE (UPF0057 family)
MKKYYFLGVLALTLVFTSCSIEKRHYMNGYHVTWNHKAERGTSNTAAGSTTVTETAAVAPVSAVQSDVAAEAEEVTVAAAPSLVQSPVQTANGQSAAVSQNENNTVVTAPAATEQSGHAKKNTFIQKRLHNTATPAPDEVDKVLLVILAILIPPLAMYLYEGAWTSRCTVNLILTLLCGIPGVIHALIVILGGK